MIRARLRNGTCLCQKEGDVADATHGLGGLKYDPAKRTRAPEWNVFGALVLIMVIADETDEAAMAKARDLVLARFKADQIRGEKLL